MTTDIHQLPRDTLLFYVADDVTSETRGRVEALISTLQSVRLWLIAPPRLVDITEDLATREGDQPVITLGGELELVSARNSEELPTDLDAQLYDEVQELVQAVRRLSEEAGIAFEFMYGGVYAGAIEDGRIDQPLQVGLLNEWRKRLKR